MNDVLKAEPRSGNRIPYLGKGLMGGGWGRWGGGGWLGWRQEFYRGISCFLVLTLADAPRLSTQKSQREHLSVQISGPLESA